MNSAENRTAFISYRHETDGRDLESARKIRNALNNLGWTSFLAPACIAPGNDWRERIRDSVQTAALFIAVLTKEWAESGWTRLELKLYLDSRNLEAKPVIVVPFEFEQVPDLVLLEPLFYQIQKVDRAWELSDAGICWAIHAAVTPVEVELRSDWNTRGVELLKSIREAPIPNNESQTSYVLLRDQLVSHYPFPRKIREVAQALFGEVPRNLSEDPQVAWYQIIELAKSKGLIERLRILTGLR
jgi:hypothetical protein